jgi:hypothetical protein
MRIPRNIGLQLTRLHQKIQRSGALNSEPVILRWRVTTAVPVGYLPDVEATGTGATFADQELAVSALIHYVNIHTTGFSRFAQIESGDVILDFLGDVAIDGKDSLRFIIGGKVYVQKDGGDELASSWDVRCNGHAVTRTVLVTLLS